MEKSWLFLTLPFFASGHFSRLMINIKIWKHEESLFNHINGYERIVARVRNDFIIKKFEGMYLCSICEWFNWLLERCLQWGFYKAAKKSIHLQYFLKIIFVVIVERFDSFIHNNKIRFNWYQLSFEIISLVGATLDKVLIFFNIKLWFRYAYRLDSVSIKVWYRIVRRLDFMKIKTWYRFVCKLDFIRMKS